MRRLSAISLLALLLSSCGSTPQQAQWGQGYESPQGYMEPAHSWWYYWLIYHSTLGFYQPYPTYHVYSVPYGYPRDYRPWRATEYTRTPSGAVVRQAPSAATPAPSAGGFAKPMIRDPRADASRSAGGFSKPAAPRPSPAPRAPTRSSGGFSSGSRRR